MGFAMMADQKIRRYEGSVCVCSWNKGEGGGNAHLNQHKSQVELQTIKVIDHWNHCFTDNIIICAYEKFLI